MNNILFLTKDALCKEYLPIYGNKLWKGKTPNIDELAAKGTVFNRCVTAAPSTVMSFRAIMMGKFAYEQPFEDYSPAEVEGSELDFSAIAKKLGYEFHMVWDETWNHMVLRYGNCYGKDTKIHSLDKIKQGVGCHYNRKTAIVNNEELAQQTLKRIVDKVDEICSSSKPVLVWLHLPHVINGRTAYGSDIDLFDQLIGMLRAYFSDDNIFISADHGNMNGHSGKYCYGFDVNTPVVEIPLITPRISDMFTCDYTVSNIDIKQIIFERKVIEREFVFSDTAYYAQPHRKLAIYHKNFAYIYNKWDKKEFLYDVENDRYESTNLLSDSYYDIDRKMVSPTKEYYYSPYWGEIDQIRDVFVQKRNEIWRNGSLFKEYKEKTKRRLKIYLQRIKKAVLFKK